MATIRMLGALLAVLMIYGCAPFEVNPELADKSGNHDGMLELSFSGESETKQLGQVLIRCYKQESGGIFKVKKGLVYASDYDADPVGVVTADGELLIHFLSDVSQKEVGLRNDTYFVAKGHVDNQLITDGMMMLTYGKSSSGCAYKMEGVLLDAKLFETPELATKPYIRRVEMSWDKVIHQGYFISARMLDVEFVERISFVSADGIFSCTGELYHRQDETDSWYFDCDNAKRASGSYFEGESYWSLSGQDGQENKVRIFVNI